MARGFGLDARLRSLSVDVTSGRCAPSRDRGRETSLCLLKKTANTGQADRLEFRLGVQIKDLTPNLCEFVRICADVTSGSCTSSSSRDRGRETSLLFIEEDGQRKPVDRLKFSLGIQIEDLTPNLRGALFSKAKTQLDAFHFSTDAPSWTTEA